MKTLLHNATIVNEGKTFHGYLLIDGNTISMVEHGDAPMSLTSDNTLNVIDCAGDMLLPGVIDTHVHFRDPGLTEKGDMETESRAAIAGGVTSFIDMPNTKPATVTIETWRDKMERASQASLANYAFFIGATNDNQDVISHADFSRVPGIKLFLGSSTGNMLVDDEAALNQLFAETNAIIAVHAEDEDIIRQNRAALEATYPQGNIPLTLHSTMRSSQACIKASRRAIEMARRHNARLHLLHVSTAAELELLEPGDITGKRITAETCPHYLLFTDSEIEYRGAKVKCNPAIKTAADRSALLAAVENGLIDTIATDHAPHLLVQKEGDLLHAASGMPGVQFSLQLMFSTGISTALIVNLMCHNPALLYGIEKRGFLKAGYYADIVRLHPQQQPLTISDAMVVSRCGWTPYAGLQVRHSIKTTWVNGAKAYDDGVFTNSKTATELTFKNTQPHRNK